MFVSSRCMRWVNCWPAQVATLYRADSDGRNIRPISSNNEQDNAPCPLPDGRALYTQWEYVSRSEVHCHHLWAANPDGTNQTIYYGNQHPGIVVIGAELIPGKRKAVRSSPGHGRREHAGALAIVDPRGGPDTHRLPGRLRSSRPAFLAQVRSCPDNHPRAPMAAPPS